MKRATFLHARWCAFGLITAMVLSGCSTVSGDAGGIAQTKQAQVVNTTPINVNLTLPAGVNSSSILLAASNRLTLNGAGTVGDASRLTAMAGLGSGTQLLIQAGSRIFGNVISGSPITVSSSATIYGTARSGGNIDVQAGAQVVGGVTKNSPPPKSGMGWVVDWPTDGGTPVIREARNGTLTPGAPGEAIAPGHYSDFNIKSRNRMTFSTGTYYIESFNLEPEAEIMIASSAGPVIIYVKNSFRYQGKFLPVRDASGVPTVREGSVRVAYLGTNAAEITGPFVGVLIAPNADLNLNSPNSGQHKGGFFGKNITVSANGNGSLLPLDYDLNDFTRGQTKYGDGDNDGTTDDKDLCPQNPNKVEPGVCGCNVPDTDANGDRIPDCVGPVGEFCTGKTPGTECYSTICPNNKTKETCGTNGVCGDPVAECAPGGGGSASGCYYTTFRTSIYWVCNKNVSWQTAAAMCREVPGRNLVHIDGRTENSWLDFVTSSSMWIGASAAGSSGPWSWTQGTDDGAFPFWTAGGPTGSSIDGRFTHWQTTQPSNGNCGSIGADGTWTAENCGTTHGFICEQPLNVAPPTFDGDICDFYPGAVCPGTPTPTPGTCVPATDIMAGTKDNFAAVTNDCNANCTDPSLVGTPACTDHCQGVLPIPAIGDTCSAPIGTARPVCDIEQTGYGAVCQPGVTACSGGQTCGRVYECAQLNAGAVISCKQNSDCSTNVCDLTHKVCIDPTIKITDANRAYDTNKCFVSYHCGTPTEPDCDTNYFAGGDALPCNGIEVCNPNTATSEHIDPLDPANGSNLGKTPFDPDQAFEDPDPAVTTPFADAKPAGCGDPSSPCSFGTTHPWCNPQVNTDDNKIKSQGVTDQGSSDDKKGKSGSGGALTFDFDPNLSLDYNISPALFGDATFYVDAKASATASVKLTNFLSFSTPEISVLDALGDIRVDRCGLKVDAHTRLLGLDFLPAIMGDSYDDLHKFDTDATTRTKCEQGIAEFQTEVSRVAKALRDAQELIRQYKQAVASGATLNSNFCAQVVSGFVPWDFPEINCATAKPDAVVNAFIDYYAQQAINLAGKGIDSLSLPSFGNGLFSGEVKLAGKEGRESQNLLNLPFAIGPIPMSLTVDAFLTYGISGGLQFGLTPDGFLQTLKNRDPADLAYARANATPHAGAGIEMFVGAGFDCGFAAAKIGISGDVNVADIYVPLTAGAYLNVRSEGEDRPLPEDLKVANNGSPSYEVYFPPVGPSRFRFGAGYEYNARVDVVDILHGQINAQLKLKFLFFSKTWRAKIAEFAGLQDQHYQLFSGRGGIDGAIDLSGVDLGAVSMPLPFLKLPHVDAAPSGGTPVPFDSSRVEHVFYDNQCAVRPPQLCPRIFDTVPADGYWYDAEQSNVLAAYGTSGFTVGNNVYMWSDYQTGPNYNGDLAIGTATGSGAFGSNDHVGFVQGGKTVTYPQSSYPPNTRPYIGWNSAVRPTTGLAIWTDVPGIVLSASFPGALTRPQNVTIGSGTTIHYLPNDYAGTVTVQNGGTLSLDGTGQYFFNSLKVDPGGVVIINHGSGAVEIAVKDAFTWQGQLVNGSGRENAHVVGYYGTTAVTLNSPYGFNGTFVAKNASVTLAPAYYHGAVYAKTLVVQAGAYIGFLPCHLWVPPPPEVVIT
jgi:hypothetical protein